MPAEQYLNLNFPKAGIDLTQHFGRWPRRPQQDGNVLYVTPVGKNVRAFEPGTQRTRGGSRPGLKKYISTPVVADWIVQELNVLSGIGYSDPSGGTVQGSQSGRIVTLVAVAKGNVYVASPGDTTWTAATNNTGTSPPLNFSGVMQSAQNAPQTLYFADGVNYVKYVPRTNSVEKWEATGGSGSILPVDSDNNKPRLICTWRGRTVLAGLIKDPATWFMSKVDDPTNWNYNPVATTPKQAVAGNSGDLGLIGDVITGMIPYTDDLLIFLCDHSIYMLRGDPAAGGQIDLISKAIGGAWGQAWCTDPTGTIYFMSNLGVIYTLIPGQAPVQISTAVDQLLRAINTGENGVRLQWDDRFQGLHVWVTPLAGAAATTHYFFEIRTNAWWTDTFTDINKSPLCCVTLDGNLPGDRVPLIGSWDGYVRAVDYTATTDDGDAIASEVWIGPILTKDLDEVLLKSIQGVLGETSASVTYAIHVGSSAEEALSSTAVLTGTFGPGRNLTQAIRRAGHAIYIKLTSTSAWAMESIRAALPAQVSKVRRRGA